MKAGRLLFFLAAAALAAVVLPAIAAADSGYTSYYSGYVNSGDAKTVNGCNMVFTIQPNATWVNMRIQSYDHTMENITIPENGSYYFWDKLLITVVQVDGNASRAYVDIATPATTATPTPGGTKLTCDTPGLQALAGDTVLFPITIQNNDNDDRTYTLSASSGTGWSLRFVSGDKALYKIFVPGRSSKTVNLEVRTSSATGVGEKKVTASVDSQSIDVFVYITSVNQSADVSTSVSSKIASIGDTITYDITIRNLQTQENIYRLSASGLPGNWYFRYKESAGSTQELAETVVPAGGTKTLVLEIVPPYSVAAGDYNFTATVIEPGGNAINRNFMLRLKSGVGMTMQASKLAYDAKPGQTFNIDVYVTNSGNGAALTNVYLDIDAPDGWIVQSSPNKTTSLTAGSTQKFTVRVTPPGNIVASDYDITIKAKSDQAEKEKDFRIKITVDSYIPFIGAGIILFVLVGLVLVYRKYGRR